MTNLNEFENIIRKYEKELHGISSDDASIKTSVDRWSRKEILGHLIDSANVNYHRFISALSKADLIFGTYPQNEWVELQNYNNRNWQELIELWKNLNIHIINLLESISSVVLSKQTTQHNFNEICWKLVDEGTKSSLEYLIDDYFGHLKHHINQIINY